MNKDLSLLHSNTTNSIDISGNYSLDESYFGTSGVKKCDNIKVVGEVLKKDDEDYIKCQIDGNMIIEDSVSLEEIEYPYHIEYDDYMLENWRKNENTLDILEFLWENILLEVPLQFTKVRDLSKFHGDGWRLIREDELENNNPFSELLKDFEEE